MKSWNTVPLADHIYEESYVTPALRRAVFDRDNYECQRCGESSLSQLSAHHIIYRSLMGKHELENLVTICGKCHGMIHSGKTKVKYENGVFYFSQPAPNLKGLRKVALDILGWRTK